MRVLSVRSSKKTCGTHHGVLHFFDRDTPSAKRTVAPQDADDGPRDGNELLVAALHV